MKKSNNKIRNKNKNTTLIAIDNDYIEWIRSQNYGEELTNPNYCHKPTEKEITDYINNVLMAHQQSWNELLEDN